jgi:molybdopterin/thiamine biosynthesis adenylyltransferase
MDHTRHANIFNVPSGFSVTIIGAGGIGATTALTLAKMGVRTLSVFDDDVISDENIPTQLHVVSDVGEYKVLSLARTLQLYSDELDFLAFQQRVTSETALRSSLVISAVDSITARQDIWQALNNPGSSWEYFIDARMAAEELQLFVLRKEGGDAIAGYETHLMGMDENSAEDLPCTMKATFFCAMAAGGAIGAEVRNIVRGESRSHRLVYYIPACTMYDLDL